MTQPLPRPDRDDSRSLLDTIGEQILLNGRLLENTARMIANSFGITGCVILDSDLDSEKILYRSSIDCQKPREIEFLRYLCHRYQKQLERGETIVLSPKSDRLSKAFPSPPDSVALVPLCPREFPLGFLCLYTREKAEDRVSLMSLSSGAIRPLADQCTLLLQQSRDLSRLEREYLEKQAIEDDLQEKINEYLAHITHELRAPLAGILGFARMLQEQIYGTLTDKQYRYIGAIASSGEHLLSLVNDFQDLSKIEANFEEIFPEKLVVEDVCLASLSIVRARAEEQGLQLDLEIAPAVAFCYADQQRLKQILVNLLSNAVKFTENGSVTLKVQSRDDRLIFSVIDTGIGIPLEEQVKLFQPFQQIPNALSRKHKGTGLGLALSRKLARLHGGDITVISEKGKGSCFTLDLPGSGEGNG